MPAADTARTPAAPRWPDQLITRAEAFELAAEWPVYVFEAQHGINLYCGRCDRSAGQLRRGEVTYNGSLDEMLAMVLRHMVMAHDVPLAGIRQRAETDPARVPGPAVTPEQVGQSWAGRHG